jgi:hypothetical protein
VSLGGEGKGVVEFPFDAPGVEFEGGGRRTKEFYVAAVGGQDVFASRNEITLIDDLSGIGIDT